MSVTDIYGRAIKNKQLSTVHGVLEPWVRPADWLTLPSIVSTDQKFVGLHAVYPDSNFIALSAAGNYTVDWGDGGATEDFASGVVAYHTYDYTNAYFDGTLTDRGYKQAIVTVTPQTGQNLTTINLHQKHNQSGLNLYSSGFLDIAIAGSLVTSLLIGVQTAGASTQVISFRDLEQVNILSTAITSASYLFYGCSSLGSVAASTATVTDFTSMFQYCYSLQTIPLLNTATGTNFTSMFSGCASLQTGTTSGPRYALSYASCKLSQTALQAIIDNLGISNTTGLVFTISTNWGVGTIVSLSGTTTAGSLTVTMADTTGIAAGMQVTGIGTPSTTAIAVTFTDTGDTVNLVGHGLSNNDEVSFATIVTTTGIIINKIYYVVGAAADTFQVALTQGGAAIDLVTNGTGTLRYKAVVDTITPNVSVTLNRKATSTGANTLSFRNLKTNTALLKGWAITG